MILIYFLIKIDIVLAIMFVTLKVEKLQGPCEDQTSQAVSQPHGLFLHKPEGLSSFVFSLSSGASTNLLFRDLILLNADVRRFRLLNVCSFNKFPDSGKQPG